MTTEALIEAAIAETKAYIAWIEKQGSKSNYEYGKLYALRAARHALKGKPAMLKSFSTTTFREGTYDSLQGGNQV